jgi:LysM repeat protein
MFTHFPRKTLKQLGIAILSLTLVLSVLAASLPQPVKAATDTVACDTYYTVKTGDTLKSIAQAYGLKWRDLADANNLNYPYKIKVGQKLCIPSKESAEEENLTLSVLVRGTSIVVNVSKATVRNKFYIKVRAGDIGFGGWYKIGSLKVPKKTAVTGVYSLPKDLRTVSPITVCLKNASTDQLICRTVVHY